VIDTDEADRDPAKVTPMADATATAVAFAAGLVDATLAGNPSMGSSRHSAVASHRVFVP
jgi:hypothetical protein